MIPPRDMVIPALRVIPEGAVLIKTDCFDGGDGVKVTMTNTDLVIEVRAHDSEGSVSVPVTIILAAIEAVNHAHGS